MAIPYTSVDEIRREYLTSLSTAEVPPLANIIESVSRAMDRYCNRRFWTTTADETRLFDGPNYGFYYGWPTYPWPTYGSRTYNPGMDIASLTTLEVAADSVAAASGTYTSLSTADWSLEPYDRPDGFPAQWISIVETNTATYNSSTPFQYFQPGIRTIRLTGKFGWNTTTVDSSSFPQELRNVAIELAVKRYRAREQGYSGTLGVTEIGTAGIRQEASPWSLDVLDAYRRNPPY